jgi:pimeloyl-ACP methyl ester carboxylesterase
MVSIESPVEGYQALSVAGEQIDAVYIEESYGERFGAIVLFHDLGQQFETRDVITPLRHELAQYGWSTLTLTLAYLDDAHVMLSTSIDNKDQQTESDGQQQTGTDLPAVSNEQRTQAALAFLEAKEIDRVLFLGHGEGGRVAAELLSQLSIPINGLVFVNTPEIEEQFIEPLKLPIFDLYGSNALAGIEQAIKKRTVAMKRAENSNYVAREIIGANHAFYGMDSLLVNSIRAWLKKTYLQDNY